MGPHFLRPRSQHPSRVSNRLARPFRFLRSSTSSSLAAPVPLPLLPNLLPNPNLPPVPPVFFPAPPNPNPVFFPAVPVLLLDPPKLTPPVFFVLDPPNPNPPVFVLDPPNP